MKLQILTFILAGIFVLIGVFLRNGKMSFLASRYQYFQKIFRKRKFTVEEESLMTFFASGFFILAELFIGSGLSAFLPIESNEVVTQVIFGFSIIVGIIGTLYVNLSTRFLKFE